MSSLNKNVSNENGVTYKTPQATFSNHFFANQTNLCTNIYIRAQLLFVRQQFQLMDGSYSDLLTT